MANTRKDGLVFLAKYLADGHIAVSKYYSAKESWTRTPCWWFDIPLKKLQDSSVKHIHLLCRRRGSQGFHYLRIPVPFMRNNKKSLAVVVQNGRRIIRLHLSARRKDLFRDLRSPRKISFGKLAFKMMT